MTPTSQVWPKNRAILMVHGVGDAKPGDYAQLRKSLKTLLGSTADDFVIYELYYNFVNDWFKEKVGLSDKLQQAKSLLTIGVSDPDLADAVAEYVGDVLWPVLSRDARAAVRTAYLAQLKQIVKDGINAGVDPPNQKLTIIAHSLGCFYTYEALHTAAERPTQKLQPYSDGVRFDNVVLMASPIQLIRKIGDAMGPAVPNKNELSTFAEDGLVLPGQRRRNGVVLSARNWISITGELDPVGGFFYRKRAAWAYTQIEGQMSIVDPQTLLGIESKADLIQRLVRSVSDQNKPDLKIANPHSWVGYVARHERELNRWLTV